MKTYFRTNLDLNPNESWPIIDCIPPKGTLIQSNTGLELEVYRVTVKKNDLEIFASAELHLPMTRFKNVSDFQKWYKNRNYS